MTDRQLCTGIPRTCSHNPPTKHAQGLNFGMHASGQAGSDRQWLILWWYCSLNIHSPTPTPTSPTFCPTPPHCGPHHHPNVDRDRQDGLGPRPHTCLPCLLHTSLPACIHTLLFLHWHAPCLCCAPRFLHSACYFLLWLVVCKSVVASWRFDKLIACQNIVTLWRMDRQHMRGDSYFIAGA